MEQNDLNRELIEAADKGCIKEVRKLLKNGADSNASDADEKTALSYAS